MLSSSGRSWVFHPARSTAPARLTEWGRVGAESSLMPAAGRGPPRSLRTPRGETGPTPSGRAAATAGGRDDEVAKQVPPIPSPVCGCTNGRAWGRRRRAPAVFPADPPPGSSPSTAARAGQRRHRVRGRESMGRGFPTRLEERRGATETETGHAEGSPCCGACHPCVVSWTRRTGTLGKARPTRANPRFTV